MKKLLVLAAFAALFAYKASAQTTVAVKNAAKHIGQTVKICDKVVDGKLITTSNITFLNIGDNPNQQLTIMIPAADRTKFKGKPEVDYRGKDIIVTGKLATYKGKPQITVSDPKQIKIVLMDNSTMQPISRK
jgi:DNA/RNA endonuclease YhcR with UshA esterase domain